MAELDDAVARLALANPVSLEELDGGGTPARALALVEAILAMPRTRSPWAQRLLGRRQIIPVAGAMTTAASSLGRLPVRADSSDPIAVLRRAEPAAYAIEGAAPGLSVRAEALFHAIITGERTAPAFWWQPRRAVAPTPYPTTTGVRLPPLMGLTSVSPSPGDPLEALRLVNPVAASAEDAGLSMRAEMVLESIMNGTHEPSTPAWWRRRRVLVPLAGILALGASAAGYVLANAPTTRTVVTACYKTADLQSERVLPATGNDPIAACATVWASGALGTPPSPHLVGCVLPSGYEAVFPGSGNDVCSGLGLSAALPASSTDQNVGTLILYLETHISPATCLTEQPARTVVLNEFSQLGLNGWSVTSVTGASGASFAVSGTCATASVDASQSLVTLVPVFPANTSPSNASSGAPNGPN